MSEPPLRERLRSSRVAQVLLLYLGASWIVIEVAGALQDALALPDWVTPVAIVLLLVGLVVVLATAWVQSHPTVDRREAAGEVPESWAVGVGDLVRAVRSGRMPHLTWARALVGGAFAFWLLFGLAGLFVLLQDDGGGTARIATADEAGVAIVVVPFSVSGADPDVFREGMVTLLSTTLDGVADFRAVDSRTVLARWEETVEEGQTPDLATVLQVAGRAGGRYALVGSAVGTGSNVRLDAEVFDVPAGEKLGAVRAEGPADSLTSLVDRLSVAATRVLLAEGEDVPFVQHVASLTTQSLPALLAYVEGERHYRQGDFGRAIDAYERAIALDSTFALAHLRISSAYGWETPGVPEYQGHLRAAERFAQRLSARERAFLDAVQGVAEDDVDALPGAERAVRRYPDDPDLWNALGELQVHVGQRALRPVEEELAPLARAAELIPDFLPYLIHLVEHQIAFGDSATAADLVRREVELTPDARFTRDHQAAFRFRYGSAAARRAVVDYVAEEGVSSYLNRSMRGTRWLEPREALLRSAVEAAPERGGLIASLAAVLANRGRVQQALALTSPATQAGSAVRTVLHLQGLLPADSLRRLDWQGDSLGVAVAAAALGDWDTFGTAREALQRRLTVVLESRPDLVDLPSGRQGTLPMLDAYATWRRSGAVAAESAMEEALRIVPDNFLGVVLLWLGRLHDELGNGRRALDCYRAAARDLTFAHLLAARVADRLGMAEDARHHYRELLIAWKDADPRFQPWLEEARDWSESLPG